MLITDYQYKMIDTVKFLDWKELIKFFISTNNDRNGE